MNWLYALENFPRVVAFGPLGVQEIVFILLLIFILFGAKKIPELMRSLGRAQGEYMHAKKEFEREVKGKDKADEDDPTERMRRKAEEMGIDTKGKDLDQLQRAIAAEGGDTSRD